MAKEKDLSFWGHLEEFRWMLIRIFIVLVVLMAIVFLNKTFVFDSIILAPRTSDFMLYRWMCQLNDYIPYADLCMPSFELPLININLSSQFFIHFSTSFYIAIIFGFPYIIWELWRFVSPALYPKEQQSLKRAFIFSSFLFYIGVVVAYILIFPLTIRFFAEYQVSSTVPNLISLQSYISTLTSLVLAMGIVFELPVLIHILSRMGVVNRRFLRKYRRHAIVILLSIAAIITPADVFSMVMAAIPLYLLYELSIFVCKDRPKTVNS